MTTPQKGRIFISYRRADSQFAAGRIYDRLAAHFGEEAIFMDVEAIDGGVDFVKVLENAVQSCDVVLVLVGRQWLNIKDERGERRLDNPDDFVRVEVAAALDREIRVIPVLVEFANMPRSTELPENLKPLSRRNALLVNHQTFSADANRLIAHVNRALESAEEWKQRKAKVLKEAQAILQSHNDQLLTQAETAISTEDWALAQEKLRDILRLDENNLDAQGKLDAVEVKLAELEAEEERQREAERLAREKRAAEEKARQATLRKERQKERIDNVRNFFSKDRKRFLFGVGGIALIFLIGYAVNNIQPPVETEPTKEPATQVVPTATLGLPTSTSMPEATLAPTKTSALTENPATPTPALGVGSTMVSEKDGMTLVYVPAGEFQMGSEDGADDEKPVHTVYLDAYWIDQTEVTNAMYAKCVATGACDEPYSTSSYYFDSYYGNPEFNNYPVIYVSWGHANNYCTWAKRRLPTEAEWEKASRGGLDGAVYPWGDDAPVCEYGAKNGANFNDREGCHSRDTDTEPVGSYSANGYGAYDMAGNVMEWTSSLYKDYPYSASDGREDSISSGNLVLRGGSWFVFEHQISSAARSDLYRSYWNSYSGFRCARSP